MGYRTEKVLRPESEGKEQRGMWGFLQVCARDVNCQEHCFGLMYCRRRPTKHFVKYERKLRRQLESAENFASDWSSVKTPASFILIFTLEWCWALVRLEALCLRWIRKI